MNNKINKDIKQTNIEYGAITIDTQMFKEYGCNFNSGLLSQIHQFNGGIVHVLQTDIVHNELLKHISNRIESSKITIDKAFKLIKSDFNTSSKIIDNYKTELKIPTSSIKFAEDKLNNYYKLVDAKLIMPDELVNIKDLTEMYFKTIAPFENKPTKKHEFPDAIALLSLEKWAEENNTPVIAVSKDKGWLNYAETSKNICVYDNLAKAIEYFLPHNRVKEIIDYLNDGNIFQDKQHIFDDITKAIHKSINVDDVNYVNNFDILAESDFPYEVDEMFLNTCDYKLLNNKEGIVDFNVVGIQSDSITIILSAEISCEFEAGFHFYFFDSVDKEYLSFGTTYHSVNIVYKSDISITLKGDFSKTIDDIKVGSIGVAKKITYLDFGFVEPES